MNIIQGLQVQGLSLSTEENFNSIPGLTLWMDGSERRQDYAGLPNETQYWQSKKEPFTQFSMFSANSFRPVGLIFSDPKCVRTITKQLTPEGTILRGARFNTGNNNGMYSFINSGGAFGIYLISRYNSPVALPDAAISPIIFGSNTTGNSQVRINYRINATAGNSYRVAFADNGTTFYQISPNGSSILPINQINSFRYLFKGNGVSNNHSVFINNASSFTGTQDLAFTPTNNVTGPQLNIAENQIQLDRLITLEGYMVLVYNFNGISPTVIDDYDLRIRTLLEKYKLTL